MIYSQEMSAANDRRWAYANSDPLTNKRFADDFVSKTKFDSGLASVENFRYSSNQPQNKTRSKRPYGKIRPTLQV